jgi:hypothetical protein
VAIRSFLAVLILLAALVITGRPAAAVNDCLIVPSGVLGTTMLLTNDCTTNSTIFIPNGMTFDGGGHRITAIDPVPPFPAPPEHFLGAVLRNEPGATEVHVTNVEILGQISADACDAGDNRLRGILFDGAGGTITNNRLFDIRQGPSSGCQEGNAIEVRSFTPAGEPTDPRFQVTISDNVVRGYQKTGIVANGGVDAIIGRNIVSGDNGITFIAQNGIQVGFGATALISANAISGNNYLPNPVFACGIIIFDTDGVDAKPQDNLFPPQGALNENEKDLCVFHRGGNYEPYGN